jgi:TIR domain/Interferon-induced transmembrane protein
MAIFLSYSRHDEKVVKALAQGFEAARRQVWIDADLSGGDAWWDKILHNIRSCSVFLFALSDASWASKPCQAELAYARALHRPIIPVLVGEVRNLRANPLAQLQIVNYRVDDANAGFELLAAVDAAARSARPLPLPPPPEPPIPYAYLLGLERQIDSVELDPHEQRGVVEQLGKSLGDETDESVRRDIVSMLEKLANKPWIVRRTERDIKALLFAHASDTDPPPGAPASRPAPPMEIATPPVAEPPRPSEPDGREIFERRMAELRSRQEAEERRKAEHQQAWQGTPAASPWGGPSSSGGATASHGTWGGVTTPPPPEPQPTQFQPTHFPSTPFQAQQFVPQQFVPGGQTTGQAVAPPNYLGLSIVGFVLSLPAIGIFGGIALYFSHQVGQRFAMHDHAGAAKASANARTWAIVGIVVGIFFILLLAGAGG